MKRVGVMMGGPSSEHDISLLTGANIMRALASQYEVIPIFISHNGAWLVGERREWLTPHEALMRVDVVFNALHGEFGEDGTVQHILNHYRMPYTGSGALASAVAMNKAQSQEIFKAAGLRTPRSIVIGPHNLDTRAVLALSAPPWIVKPRSRGSSLGVSKVKTRNDLSHAFADAFKYDTHLIVQEFIPGREITCGVLENSKSGKPEALVPIEIVPPKETDFFNYQVKYNGATTEICPADFYGAMLAHVQDVALRAHQALGLRHYSRTDMILKPSDATRRAPEIYVLETNTLPGLTRESLFPKAARHAGFEIADLARHLVELAATSRA